MTAYTTQNDLLLNKLEMYYKDTSKLSRMLSIINGDSNISLRIVDWFVTNYAKTIYMLRTTKIKNEI